MIVYPNCKINLGLQVLRKRADHFHDIDSVFYPVQWRDIIEANHAENFKLTQTGLTVDSTEQDNLIAKAYFLLKKDFPQLSLQFHLHKLLPMGAGLGGGSSDAAFALMLINDLAELKLSEQQLLQRAAQLGSDCSFFIRNKCAWINSRGDQYETLNFSIEHFKLLFVHPSIFISTKEAFETIQPKENRKTTKEVILHSPIEDWKNCLFNDFETGAFKKYPILDEIKKSLYSNGAIYAAMSGSGSCLYGIFSAIDENLIAEYRKKGYYCKWV